MAKVASNTRAIVQQLVSDGSDTESIPNGENSSPYMSNAISGSSTTTSMAPIGDGVSIIVIENVALLHSFIFHV